MTTNTNPTNLLDLAGNYGPRYQEGVLLEHVGHLEGTGSLTLVFDAEGHASLRQGETVLPVRCGELVEDRDEDGPIVIRCGAPVHRESVRTFGACQGHHEVRSAWQASGEADRIAWERRQDELGR